MTYYIIKSVCKNSVVYSKEQYTDRAEAECKASRLNDYYRREPHCLWQAEVEVRSFQLVS